MSGTCFGDERKLVSWCAVARRARGQQSLFCVPSLIKTAICACKRVRPQADRRALATAKLYLEQQKV